MSYRNIIKKYQYNFMHKAHVIGVGCGLKEKDGEKTDKKAVVVLVDKKLSRNKLRSKDLVPREIEGYETDVIECGRLEFIDLRKEKMRPAKPGVSIGHYEVSAGTLGAIVKDAQSDEPLILSNNHVLANITNGRDNRAEIGDEILQPAKYDKGKKTDDVIGTLERFVPIYRGGDEEASTCPVAKNVEILSNYFIQMVRPDYKFRLFKQGPKNKVDCALAKPNNYDDLDEEIIELGKVKGVAEPDLEMKVKKSGRSTGLTKGEIRVMNTTVEVNMSQTEVAIFEDQFITEPMSRAGDSGSLILNSDNKAVGLLFAGSQNATVCNNIYNVINALNIKF